MTRAIQAVQWIRSEYRELPGLALTRRQVQRLFGLDDVTCEGVLAALVDVQFLAERLDGRFVRADFATADTAFGSRVGRAA